MKPSQHNHPNQQDRSALQFWIVYAILITIACIIIALLSGCTMTPSPKRVWVPMPGDVVITHFREGYWYERIPITNRITTIERVVFVGAGSQSGYIVYGPGLPGVDLCWIKPLAHNQQTNHHYIVVTTNR